MADLIVTDPPYNVAIENSQGMTIANDNLSNEEFQDFLNNAFLAMSSSTKKGGAFYVWHADKTQREVEDALDLAEMPIRAQLIWIKNSFILGWQDYQWQHERTLSTVIDGENVRPEEMNKEELEELVKKIYELPTTIIREDKPLKNSQHPDMKPVKLFGYLIKNSSRPNEIVLDPFAGSGTTVIACEQLGRKAYVVEYDPRYADVIIDRWEKLTGEKARKIE